MCLDVFFIYIFLLTWFGCLHFQASFLWMSFCLHFQANLVWMSFSLHNQASFVWMSFCLHYQASLVRMFFCLHYQSSLVCRSRVLLKTLPFFPSKAVNVTSHRWMALCQKTGTDSTGPASFLELLSSALNMSRRRKVRPAAIWTKLDKTGSVRPDVNNVSLNTACPGLKYVLVYRHILSCWGFLTREYYF